MATVWWCNRRNRGRGRWHCVHVDIYNLNHNGVRNPLNGRFHKTRVRRRNESGMMVDEMPDITRQVLESVNGRTDSCY